MGPAYSPTTYRVIMKKQKQKKDKEVGGNDDDDDSHHQPPSSSNMQEHRFPRPGWGMFWEADECARCIRDGKGESEVLGLEESVVIMKVMDEVRRQNGLVYPDRIESTAFPLEF